MHIHIAKSLYYHTGVNSVTVERLCAHIAIFITYIINISVVLKEYTNETDKMCIYWSMYNLYKEEIQNGKTTYLREKEN